MVDTGPVDLSRSVVPEGGVGRATGRVMVVDDAVWFEQPLPEPAVLITPPRPPRPGPFAVRAYGVDLDRLAHREMRVGVLIASATLTGVWRGNEVIVHEQSEPPPWQRWTDRWTTPPCPPPPEGWPYVPERGRPPGIPPQPDRWAELTITQVTQFHPAPRHAAIVIAALDTDLVERALRPTMGEVLCVVRSEFRQEQIDEVMARLHAEQMSGNWPVLGHGRTASERGQPMVSLAVLRVVPSMVPWAATVPDGLLDLEVWLKPA